MLLRDISLIVRTRSKSSLPANVLAEAGLNLTALFNDQHGS